MAPTEQTFPFEFEPVYQALCAPFGVRPSNAVVRVGPVDFVANFGPWAVRVPLDQIDETHVTGPYGLLKTGGPARMSFKDRGLTFATNRRRGLCVHFAEPVPGIEPFGAVRHPALTVTVADVDGLARALAGATGR